MAEDAGTTGHTERAALAQTVLDSPDRGANMLALGVLVQINPSSDSYTDAEITSALSAIWDAYAGVNA